MKQITEFQYKIFTYLSLFLYLCYILLFFGISLIDTKYIHIMMVTSHLILCFLILYRFNIFHSERLIINYYEKIFIFNAGLLLVFNIFVYEIGIRYIPFLKNLLMNPSFTAFLPSSHYAQTVL